MARYEDIIATVGRTPVVRVRRLGPKDVELYVKVEARNPMGSVKDRLAVGIIEAAEKSGALRPGQTVIEATSGNTGIGLAMVCARRGYPLVVVMAENFSVERRKIMRFLGAKVVLTPAAEKGMGMLRKALELAEAHGWFLTRQFENEANADVHSRTTALEILEDFPEGLDYWVTGFGTGGTLKGVARVLKERSPRTKVVVCEPENSQTYASATRLPWPADGVPKESHPLFRPHPVQGWAPDFVPKLAEDARAHVDQIVPVSGLEALELARTLAVREGILTGISGGATLAGALAVCAGAERGARILCMLPDTGERYLSTPLFDNVPVDMTEEEVAISHSTPSARFDKAPDVPPAAGASAAPTAEARAFVREVIESTAQPVVVFALTWCEFTWAVRKLFKRCGIAYRAVDLDGVAYQNDNWGGKIRAALTEYSGVPTIPQIFVGAKLVGDASQTFAAFEEGRLQALLQKQGVPFEDKVGDKLYSLMPGWAQVS
ncbi:MAG TPA: pyridoxal-phosphate dependent enzyme [Polyangia bacterium]|nr:pyridoxal-phosphate dependent enzyme [Polyangia bacterium]